MRITDHSTHYVAYTEKGHPYEQQADTPDLAKLMERIGESNASRKTKGKPAIEYIIYKVENSRTFKDGIMVSHEMKSTMVRTAK